MASDGYVVVKSDDTPQWFVGASEHLAGLWSTHRRDVKRFASQKEFKAWFHATFGVRYEDAWRPLRVVRFVRVRPRKEAA